MQYAIDIQKCLFPQNNGEHDIKGAVESIFLKYYSGVQYWLGVDQDGKYIGMTGLYAYKEYPEDAWLGWYGVLENYRNLGYGTQILIFAKQQAAKMGYKTLRLYTDDVDNAVAVQLYKKLKMDYEKYVNFNDKHLEFGNTLIFSLSLCKEPIQKWDNKCLFLNDHELSNIN